MDTNIFKETIFLIKCHVKLINIWDKLEKSDYAGETAGVFGKRIKYGRYVLQLTE